MIGGYEDNLVGPILCFTLRGQSDIREIPDPENVFKALFLGRVRVHGKKAGSDPIPGGMRNLVISYLTPLDRENHIQRKPDKAMLY